MKQRTSNLVQGTSLREAPRAAQVQRRLPRRELPGDRGGGRGEDRAQALRPQRRDELEPHLAEVPL